MSDHARRLTAQGHVLNRTQRTCVRSANMNPPRPILGEGTLALPMPRVPSGSEPQARSVRLTAQRWQPPEGLALGNVLASIAAAATERDRLQRDALILPNRKNPSVFVKRVFRPQGQADLPGALLLWAREHALIDTEPLFFSRKRGPDGERRATTRGQAWLMVRRASERADVRVLALRRRFGVVGQPGPVHPHLFRHARVRKIVRDTHSLPLAQRQAGWSRLQMTYLPFGDDEARQLVRQVTE
jgi:integrase